MLKDSLQLAEKYCKVFVDQVDYLKFAANKDRNKRIEEVASEAMECLVSQVQHKLRYASVLFRSQSESAVDDCSAESSSSTSSPESSPSCSPVARSRAFCSLITSSELKKAADRDISTYHDDPHAIKRRNTISGGELKKIAEKFIWHGIIIRVTECRLHSNPHAIQAVHELKKTIKTLIIKFIFLSAITIPQN